VVKRATGYGGYGWFFESDMAAILAYSDVYGVVALSSASGVGRDELALGVRRAASVVGGTTINGVGRGDYLAKTEPDSWSNTEGVAQCFLYWKVAE